MKILILDDDEVRHERFKIHLFNFEVVHAHTYDQFLELVGKERFDAIFLDHDLEFEEKAATVIESRYANGMDAARHVAALPEKLRPELVVVHSWNMYAASRMMDVLLEAKYVSVRWVFESHELPARLWKMLRDIQLKEENANSSDVGPSLRTP